MQIRNHYVVCQFYLNCKTLKTIFKSSFAWYPNCSPRKKFWGPALRKSQVKSKGGGWVSGRLPVARAVPRALQRGTTNMFSLYNMVLNGGNAHNRINKTVQQVKGDWAPGYLNTQSYNPVSGENTSQRVPNKDSSTFSLTGGYALPYLLQDHVGDFPGGTMNKIPLSRCRGHRFSPPGPGGPTCRATEPASKPLRSHASSLGTNAQACTP